MKKKSVKFMALLLCAVLMIGVMPVTAMAARVVDNGSHGALRWEFASDGTLTISGSGSMNRSVRGYPWDEYRYRITSIIIGSGVTTIADWAFENYTSVTNVELPYGLTRIGFSAFYNCTALEEVTIPGSVSFVDHYAFDSCTSLTDVIIESSVITFASAVFAGCTDLESFVAEGTVTTLGDDFFYDCTSLQEVVFSGNAPNISDSAFARTKTTVYYPNSNRTWNNTIDRNYGGELTWVGYGLGSPNIPINGDADGDGELTAVDLVLAARYLIGGFNIGPDMVRAIEEHCDMNDDGQITNADIVAMGRILIA